MKRIVEENSYNDYEEFLNLKITLYCANYIYTGILVGITDKSLKLKDPSIVYDTGNHSLKEFECEESLFSKYRFINKDFVESYGIMS